ncbi:MAG: protein tyrosine phosphatase [Xanthobacteraceae bacterium]|nr:protein tyrosine phosphatase [Xanthobacteraceae bacterium]
MIHVCSLSRLHDTVAACGARHVVSLLGNEDNLLLPGSIARADHLWLQFHDIIEPRDGHIHPAGEHIERLIGFVQRWERASPMVIHCYAGVSRSTAAAFVAVCTLNPAGTEAAIARALRRASPTATPNLRIVSLADEVLGRRGSMVEAVAAIGQGMLAEAAPFQLELQGH